MISKADYDKIAAGWEGEVFQIWARIKKRVPLFEKKLLPHLAGKHVLEIGCNAGIYAWHIAQVASSYVGVDISENFIRQAKVTAEHIHGSPTRFLCTSLRDFAASREDFDAVFASFLLYHLSDAEVEIFEKQIAPRCDVLAVQIRAKKRHSFNSYDLVKAKNVAALFDRAGFDSHIYWANWRHTAFQAVGIRRLPRTPAAA